jgi:hypothetical protein
MDPVIYERLYVEFFLFKEEDSCFRFLDIIGGLSVLEWIFL